MASPFLGSYFCDVLAYLCRIHGQLLQGIRQQSCFVASPDDRHLFVNLPYSSTGDSQKEVRWFCSPADDSFFRLWIYYLCFVLFF